MNKSTYFGLIKLASLLKQAEPFQTFTVSEAPPKKTEIDRKVTTLEDLVPLPDIGVAGNNVEPYPWFTTRLIRRIKGQAEAPNAAKYSHGFHPYQKQIAAYTHDSIGADGTYRNTGAFPVSRTNTYSPYISRNWKKRAKDYLFNRNRAFDYSLKALQENKNINLPPGTNIQKDIKTILEAQLPIRYIQTKGTMQNFMDLFHYPQSDKTPVGKAINNVRKYLGTLNEKGQNTLIKTLIQTASNNHKPVKNKYKADAISKDTAIG